MKHLFRPLLLSVFIACVGAVSAAEAPATFQVGGLSFPRPAAWEWIESTSPMRKAQLKVNDAAKKDSCEVVFFHFGPEAGGGTKANVDRWFRQFAEPREQLNAKTEDVTVEGTKITYVSASGTYQSGMPGGAKTPLPNHRLIGAIVEHPEGAVFVKLTGPKALAGEAEKAFRGMVEGALKK
jgi:hypothetical protein